jgi:mono/diheme cytochrome c family protein
MAAASIATFFIAVASAQSSEDLIADRRVYVTYGCYQCHGYEGQGGGIYGGPRIGPTKWPLMAFETQLRRPRGSAIPMPAYAPEVLSEADLKRIYEYLRSIPSPSDATSP